MSRHPATLCVLAIVVGGALSLWAAPPAGRVALEVPANVVCLEKLELELTLDRGFFRFASAARHDAADADGDGEGCAAGALFLGPSGARLRVPAFFSRAHGRWRLLVRFAPEQPGTWRVRAEASDARGHAAASPWKIFVAAPSAKAGFLRTPGAAGVGSQFPSDVLVVRKGTRHRPFLGIATARAWNAPATPDTPAADWPGQQINLERDLFVPMRRSGVNVLVYWFAPWDTLLVHRGLGPRPWTRYDQDRAARMDEVVALAETYGVKLCLTIWAHPALREGDRPWQHGLWDRGPAAWRNGFAAFDGGLPCAHFFRGHDKAEGTWRELWLHQRNLLRYIVARWGYSRAVGLWCTVCLPQGMTGWQDRETFDRWHDSVVRCLRRLDVVRRPLTAVSWRERRPWVGGEERVDVAQFCVYPQWFYNPRRTTLDAGMRAWIVDEMHLRTRAALDATSGRPVFCGEYALIERSQPSDTLTTHGRRYPRYLRLASWAALLGGAAILPAEWDDGARFAEHVGRDSQGTLLYDNFAELAAIAAFVRGSGATPGDFPLSLGRARAPVALPSIGAARPLALSLGATRRGLVEMIGWLPRPPGASTRAGEQRLRLARLVPEAVYEGSFRWIPGARVEPLRLEADAHGAALLTLPEYGESLAFKLRLPRRRQHPSPHERDRQGRGR